MVDDEHLIQRAINIAKKNWLIDGEVDQRDDFSKEFDVFAKENRAGEVDQKNAGSAFLLCWIAALGTMEYYDDKTRLIQRMEKCKKFALNTNFNYAEKFILFDIVNDTAKRNGLDIRFTMDDEENNIEEPSKFILEYVDWYTAKRNGLDVQFIMDVEENDKEKPSELILEYADIYYTHWGGAFRKKHKTL